MDARTKVLCEICGTNVPYGRLSNHIEECKASKPFPCGICPRFFSTQSGVSRHQGQTHSAEERGTTFRCHHTDCEFGTNSKQTLQSHLSKHITGFRRSRSRSRSRSRQPEPQYHQQQHQEEEVNENPGPQSSSRQHNVPQPAQHDHQLYQEEIVASTRSRHNIYFERQSNQPSQEVIDSRSRSRQPKRSFYSEPQPPLILETDEGPSHSGATSTTPIDANIESVENSQEPEVQNVTEVDEDETDENVTNNQEDEIGPVPGFYNLRLVDPVKARMIMTAENKALDDIVRNLRENNNHLHKYCQDRGLQLGTQVISKKIEDYMRIFAVRDDD